MSDGGKALMKEKRKDGANLKPVLKPGVRTVHGSVPRSVPRSVHGSILALGLVLPGVMASAAYAQYVGKVSQGAAKAPTLRATAVYEFTGSMAKPNASRLVPVVVWDGARYQPGGLYLAQPEPLAVAPGTQYVLEEGGIPKGLFNVGSAGELNGGWVGLGRYAAEPAPAELKKLAASRRLPQLHGGHGRGSADVEDGDNDTPVLHRHAGSEPGAAESGEAGKSTGSAGSKTGTATQGDGGPTLHRRDSDEAGGTAPDPDPDRPTLHRPASSGTATDTGTDSRKPAPDPDRPVLHARHTDEGSGGRKAAATLTPPDPDRPHLQYGITSDETRVAPVELKDVATPVEGGTGVAIGQIVAVSDASDAIAGGADPHPFAYAFASPAAKDAAQLAMHTLALRALADAARSSFGPAAKEDAVLRQAALAAAAQAPVSQPGAALAAKGQQVAASSGTGTAKSGVNASARPAAGTAAAHRKGAAAASATAPATDLLLDPDFHTFQLSYDGGTTYVYSAHTAAEGAQRRYVTVIAQADFYGKPERLFAQATRGDMLNQVPALHLIDAVDANGDHRAELLFDEQTADAGSRNPQAATARQFALFSVLPGQATEVYSSGPGVQQ
jgi:hypothetical protein